MRRRAFLRTSAIGAGVALLEGCGREREQVLVQPSRRPGVLQGESVWRPSVCGQCPAGCGIVVRVVDGDAKKIEGSPEHPVGRGGVCALGHAALQELYNPDRITAPRRRAGSPDAPDFEALTWEEALGVAVAAFSAADPGRIAFVGSDGSGFVGALLGRLAEALGAPPPALVGGPGLAVERAAARLALGVDDVPYFDVARADYVLSIGAPLLDRWRSPVHYTGSVARMRRGRPGRRGRLVHAGPRMSLTAANADEWLPIRPGTEGTLARALAGLLLDGGAGGAAAASRYRALLPDPPPSAADAGEACDVPAATIERIAGELAASERAVVVAGGSAAEHTDGLHAVTAALGLNLLLGALGRPGGVYAPVRFGLADAVGPSRTGSTSAAALAERLERREVDLLLVADVDLVRALPGGWGVADALADVGTVVALSSFLDDTAVRADLLLPLLTELERFNVVEPGASVGVRAVAVADPVLDPLTAEAHHPADVLLALATALGDPVAGRFPWSSFATLARERIEAEAAGLPGGADATPASFYFDAVARGGVFAPGEPAEAPPGPSGVAPPSTPPRLAGDAGTYPLVLLPFESLRMGGGRGANRPWLQEMPDPLTTVMWNGWLELSPADAETLGVHDGDRVRVESPEGAVETHAVIDPAARPGVVGMPLGHGHADYGRYARGRGADPLVLVGAERVDGTDAPALLATRVRVERIGADRGGLVRFGRGYGGALPGGHG